MRKRANVVVDIGNTKIKSAFFDSGIISSRFETRSLVEVLDHYGPGHQWIFGSVRESDEEVARLFEDEQHMILTRETPLPLVINYDTPETLGTDRIAAAVGGNTLHPGKDVLIIDAGTCITYDLVTGDGVFQGGVIAPGLRMRMKAMGQYTRRLPDISEDWSQIMLKNLGKSTRECLLAGSFGALQHEMNGFIDQFKKEYPELVVILTGGDANYFESKVKAPIFADFDLVLIGLNRILNHNQ